MSKELYQYMLRWQLSTPVLALVPICLSQFSVTDPWIIAITANFIGSLMFFPIDKFLIFGKVPFRVRWRYLKIKIK